MYSFQKKYSLICNLATGTQLMHKYEEKIRKCPKRNIYVPWHLLSGLQAGRITGCGRITGLQPSMSILGVSMIPQITILFTPS